MGSQLHWCPSGCPRGINFPLRNKFLLCILAKGLWLLQLPAPAYTNILKSEGTETLEFGSSMQSENPRMAWVGRSLKLLPCPRVLLVRPGLDDEDHGDGPCPGEGPCQWTEGAQKDLVPQGWV